MANLEIPVLTEIYQAGSPKTQVNNVQLSAELISSVIDQLRPMVIAEVAAELRPALEAEITSQLTAKLTEDITEKVSAQVHGALLASAEKTIDVTLKLIQEKFEQDMLQKHEALLAAAEQTMEDSIAQLRQQAVAEFHDGTANQAAELQAALIAQFNHHVSDQVHATEATFKQALEAQIAAQQSQSTALIEAQQQQFAAHLQAGGAEAQAHMTEHIKHLLNTQAEEFAQGMMDTKHQIKLQLSEHLNNQMYEFLHHVLAEQKQSSLVELSELYQAQITQTRAGFIETIEALTRESIQGLSAQSQALVDTTQRVMQETQASQITETGSLMQRQIETTLVEAVEQARLQFKQAVELERPAVESELMAYVQQLLAAELTSLENNLTHQVKTQLVETLSTVKLVLPQAQPS